LSCIPPFTPYGFLPPGVYDVTFGEAEEKFAHNSLRSTLWANLQTVLDVIKNETDGKCYPLVLGGSFVSTIVAPSDIDGAILIDGVSQYSRWTTSIFMLKRGEEWRELWHVDLYPSVATANDFSKFFQYVGVKHAHEKNLGPTDRRGVLRIREW
tara:strand:- start:17918 stop:18379 length:462 start_codon:yes stop_codon:yes gene_type:complete